MLPTLEAPELLFGLCSPVGTNNNKVTEILVNSLRRYNYVSTPFKVTTLMKSITIPEFSLEERPVERRYDTYIKYANELRHRLGDASSLAILCCAAVRAHRRTVANRPTAYLPRNAYIFDQFKRKEEIRALRQVYGRLFVLISVYSDKEARTRRLANDIASSHAVGRPTDDHFHEASALVARDEAEEGEPFGQGLSDAFPLADLFIDIDDLDAAEQLIVRFLKGLFGSNKISPTRDEYGMYIAKSAAFRSTDLSRQVGAAVFSPDGEVITMGSNEVPKAKGGTYWGGDLDDARDHVLGMDENQRVKRSLLADIVRRLSSGEFIKTEKTEEQLVDYVLDEAERANSILREALVMDLLEFGRPIHAEMSTICDAARLGRALKGSTLFCTTFPCHICAKHIIASGIVRVVYIEPYPKSYAERLHSDAMVVGSRRDGEKVRFTPFVGIAPFRYRDLFERGRRKDEKGIFKEWVRDSPAPIVPFTVATYLENETAAIRQLQESLASAQADGRAVVVGPSILDAEPVPPPAGG